MALSGLLVLVVQYIDKFSLPEGGFIILFLVFLRYNGGFGTYYQEEYEYCSYLIC